MTTLGVAREQGRRSAGMGFGPVARTVVIGGVVSVVYFLAAKLGLGLAFANASASPVWPPTGFAIAATLALGAGALPGVFLGAFLANVSTTGSAEASLLIAVGNVLEAAVAAFLVKRYAGGIAAFDTPRSIFLFVILAALLATMLSAIVGVTALVLFGFAGVADAQGVWLTWWLGDAVGALVVTPFLLQWWREPRIFRDASRSLEAGLLIGVSIVIGVVVFGGVLSNTATGPPLPLEFVAIPPVIWAAYRFGQRDVATITLLLLGIAVYGTIQGHGPFVRSSANDSLILLQAFMGVLALIGLPLAAIVRAQRRADEEAWLARAELETRVAERTHELSESKTLLLGFLQNIPGLAWAKDSMGRYVLANRAFAANAGVTVDEVIGKRDAELFPHDIALELVRNDDAVRVNETALATTERQSVRGDLRESLVTKFPIPVAGGGGPLIGGIAIDITERRRAERAVLRSLREKEALLREIHHRVKNNLQVTYSLLLLQANQTEDGAVRELLLESTDRLKSMALVHEKLYRSRDLVAVDFADYAADLTRELLSAHGGTAMGIVATVDIPPIPLDLDTAVNCGLILNELLTNAIKHAFPDGRSGRITVSGRAEGSNSFSFCVKDDGIGLPASTDPGNAKTLGMRLVASLASQVGGSVAIHREAGTAVKVTFRLKGKAEDDEGSAG